MLPSHLLSIGLIRNRKMYEAGLFWIIRERAGSGGWPPRDVSKVSGWIVVRMLAAITGRTPREVALDVIEHSKMMEERSA
jgi:hypothetical protein